MAKWWQGVNLAKRQSRAAERRPPVRRVCVLEWFGPGRRPVLQAWKRREQTVPRRGGLAQRRKIAPQRVPGHFLREKANFPRKVAIPERQGARHFSKGAFFLGRGVRPFRKGDTVFAGGAHHQRRLTTLFIRGANMFCRGVNLPRRKVTLFPQGA